MSYSLAGLGETSSWWGMTSATDEVYLFRFLAKGLPIKNPIDALLFARVVGQSMNSSFVGIHVDVRGVAVWKSPGMDDSTFMIDVVMTSPKSGFAVLAPSASKIATAIKKDTDVLSVFPSIDVLIPEILELTGPAGSIDHWRSQPILWDSALPGPSSSGGPTDTFAKPVEYSIVQGKADDGKLAKPWKITTPGLEPPGPSNGNGKKPGDNTTVLLVLVALGALGLMVGSQKRKRR